MNLRSLGILAVLAPSLMASALIAPMCRAEEANKMDLPKVLPTGKITGLRGRGGYTVDIAWKDGKVADYRIVGHRSFLASGDEISRKA